MGQWQKRTVEVGVLYDCHCRVAMQEAECWNVLLTEIRRSLCELSLGMQGDIPVTVAMASYPHRKLIHFHAKQATNLALPLLLLCLMLPGEIVKYIGQRLCSSELDSSWLSQFTAP